MDKKNLIKNNKETLTKLLQYTKFFIISLIILITLYMIFIDIHKHGAEDILSMVMFLLSILLELILFILIPIIFRNYKQTRNMILKINLTSFLFIIGSPIIKIILLNL